VNVDQQTHVLLLEQNVRTFKHVSVIYYICFN